MAGSRIWKMTLGICFVFWFYFLQETRVPSLVAHMVKNLPAMQESWVWSLGWEESLEKGMATYSSILAWDIPWTEEPCRLHSMGSQRVRQDWVTNTNTHTPLGRTQKILNNGLIPGLGRVPGEGNGHPLQYSCLENSMDRGAWQATVHGVAKNWTWLSN